MLEHISTPYQKTGLKKFQWQSWKYAKNPKSKFRGATNYLQKSENKTKAFRNEIGFTKQLSSGKKISLLHSFVKLHAKKNAGYLYVV